MPLEGQEGGAENWLPDLAAWRRALRELGKSSFGQVVGIKD